VEVVRAELDVLGQLRQRERLGRLVDEPAGLGDDGGVCNVDRDSVWVAAAAGRKPAASAAPGLSCSRTFFGFARRDGTRGPQKTPVVATEYQKLPSAALSRVTMLVQRGSRVMSDEGTS
jgi:hypothetical protein